jgi:hypothetical protein
VIAFVGTLNPSGGDVSIFLPLEHTVLSHVVADADRTAAFARYSFVGALGALSVGSVDWLAPVVRPSTMVTALFGLYGGIGLLTFLLYHRLSPQVEAGNNNPPVPLGPSRGIVNRLAGCSRSPAHRVRQSLRAYIRFAVLEPNRAFDLVRPSHVVDTRAAKVSGKLWPARFEIADVEMQERYRNARGLDKNEIGGCSPSQPLVP